jgi:spermidine synthase
VSGLYSREFYVLLRERLKEGGVAAQWIPMHSHTEPEMRMLVRSFVEVFPESTLWLPVERDAILVGAIDFASIDAGAIGRRVAGGAVAADLADAGIGSAAALFATLALDRDRLKAYVDGVAPITDDRPAIEFFAGRPLVEEPVHLARLLEFQLGPDELLAALGWTSGSSPEGPAALRSQVEAIDHYYRGAVLGATGDRAGRAAAWRLAAQLAGDDPFLGGLAGE